MLFCSCKKTNSNEKDIAVIFENLIQSFDTEGYPDYYGGSYIKDETLFILTSKNDTQVRKDLEIRGKGTSFMIETLNSNLQKGICDKLDSLSLDFYKYPDLAYYSHYMDNKKQKIVVMLSDTTRENINFFKLNIMESPYIEFEYTSPIVAE